MAGFLKLSGGLLCAVADELEIPLVCLRELLDDHQRTKRPCFFQAAILMNKTGIHTSAWMHSPAMELEHQLCLWIKNAMAARRGNAATGRAR